ncbi:WLM domain containing protein [Parasponia andersonii]|uniref:WLM domain containing protein n=1 Tax=Parasponia andersonii TaxID=3476 RepID=A0A2P5BIA1_PARAD|nr:WLM domain containing protein [Parasponia andersonii]
MEDPQSIHNVSVIWRGKKFTVQMNPTATLKELGDELQKLTHVKADTMRFIVPQFLNKSSKLLTPFSEEHKRLSLEETSITEGKPIRMMGVSENEVDEVLEGTKLNSRIAGFDEEEKRLRQRLSNTPHFSLQLPQGPYIFCDFRTLQLPGIELNPPRSEALKRMHMLAADPGIVAIMNKYRWRVGIMTEMAPVGYVGVSPKCILGFNKNHGEEISLRLRTDDLKGFRKYESIKKTLLHELAHMVYSEHDANFFALNKQLNQEAASLDWTRSRSHTLSGARRTDHFEEEEFHVGEGSHFSQKLGGNVSDQLESARVTSVLAAHRRMANASANSSGTSEVHEERDPDDSGLQALEEPTRMNIEVEEEPNADSFNEVHLITYQEPDPGNHSGFQNKFEPDPDESRGEETRISEPFHSGFPGSRGIHVPKYPETTQLAPITNSKLETIRSGEEPDPDDLEASLIHCVVAEPETFHSEEMGILDSKIHAQKNISEPDPDDLEAKRDNWELGSAMKPDGDNSLMSGTINDQSSLDKDYTKADPRESQEDGIVRTEPDPDDNLVHPVELSRMQIDEPDPDDLELQRIQDPVAVLCGRLQKAIEELRAEVGLAQVTVVFQTLFKIISNVIEHPDEMKFRRLRKANPTIKRNIANYKAAIEFLVLIGFNEDLVSDEMGKTETYLVLKRNDPGLLWLAKSCLEPYTTC